MPGKSPGPSIKWPEMYEKLRAEGKSKESAARISNAAWRKRNAQKLKKHRPGGQEHEQDQHGNWAEGRAGLGDPLGASDIEDDPVFDPFALPTSAGSGDAISDPVEYQINGGKTMVTLQGDRNVGDDELVKRSLDKFEENFPGMLPETMTVNFVESDDMNRGASAWVSPMLDPSTVHINMEQWRDNGLITQHLLTRDSWEGISFAAGQSVQFEEDAVDAYLESVVIHETAHVVAATEGFQWHWPEEVPYYGERWYSEMLRAYDDRLPSDYATLSPPEFMAEAFAEVALEGPSASEKAQMVVSVVEDHFAGRINLSPDPFEEEAGRDGYAAFLELEGEVRLLTVEEVGFLRDHYRDRYGGDFSSLDDLDTEGDFNG